VSVPDAKEHVMPVWLVLALIGVVLAALGLAGLGSVLIWVGVFIALGGLGVGVLSWRQTR